MMTFEVKCFFVICLVVTSIKFSAAEHYEIVFVSVLFRHGDRTPTRLYKNDPYPWYVFDPPGLGQLTKNGEAREYQLGLILRDRYRNFLGRNDTIPGRIKARSTDYDRTRKSMELVLSALYQPGNRRPISFCFALKGKDTLLSPTRSNHYRNELNKVLKWKQVKLKVNKFSTLMKKLTKWTGEKIETTSDIANIHHTLTAESAMGLLLPHWAQDRYIRKQIKDATILDYKIHNYNNALRKYSGGVLLGYITNTMRNKAANKVENERMNLFSAHETTVVALLSALGVYKPHVPAYSSAVIIELLRDHYQQYYTRVLYYKKIPSTPRTLPIPRCSMDPCPLNEFIRLMKHVMP